MPCGSLPQGCSSSATSMIGVTATATLWRSVGMRHTLLCLLRRLTRAPCTLHRLAVSLLLLPPRRSSQGLWAFSPEAPHSANTSTNTVGLQRSRPTPHGRNGTTGPLPFRHPSTLPSPLITAHQLVSWTPSDVCARWRTLTYPDSLRISITLSMGLIFLEATC